MRPVSTKAQYQPYVYVIHGTANGVSSAPMLVPELKIPVASARSRFGNHSATVLMAAGKLPDSPSPSRKRTKMNPATLVEAPSPNQPSTGATTLPSAGASA